VQSVWPRVSTKYSPILQWLLLTERVLKAVNRATAIIVKSSAPMISSNTIPTSPDPSLSVELSEAAISVPSYDIQQCTATTILACKTSETAQSSRAETLTFGDTFCRVLTFTRNSLDCNQSNYSSRIVFSHTPIEFGQTGISAIRSADLENPTVEPNMKWIGRPLAEIWPFEFFSKVRSSVGRSSIYTSSYTVTLISYTPLRYVRNVAREARALYVPSCEE